MQDLICRQDVPSRFPIFSKTLLERMAFEGRGPDFVTIGRKCWYRLADIEKFVEDEWEKQLAARSARRRPEAPAPATRGRGRPRKVAPAASATA